MVPSEEGAAMVHGTDMPPLEQEAYVARVPGLTEGRIVHYVLPDGSHRPAVVVKDWKEHSGSCNLQVLLDGSNDRLPGHENNCTEQEAERGIAWRTSVPYYGTSDSPGAPPCPSHTWHWPEKA